MLLYWFLGEVFMYIPENDDWLILVKEQRLLFFGDQWDFVRHGEIDARYFSERSFFLPVGDHQGSTCYVVELDVDVAGLEEVQLKALVERFPEKEGSLLSRALQLLTWHKQHRFCGQCGRPTYMDVTELAMKCDPCGLHFYPRISPCIMCLVIKGDYCLLAHHKRHKEGVYSTLAGFVEAGEHLEEAVVREVKEEVGLNVGNLQYYASQPWPFPHQLMIGYFAEALDSDINEDGEEVLDAQWFHYSRLPEIPPAYTLSGQLIARFVDSCRSKSTENSGT